MQYFWVEDLLPDICSDLSQHYAVLQPLVEISNHLGKLTAISNPTADIST